MPHTATPLAPEKIMEYINSVECDVLDSDYMLDEDNWRHEAAEPDGEGGGAAAYCWIDYVHDDGLTYRLFMDSEQWVEDGREFVLRGDEVTRVEVAI